MPTIQGSNLLQLNSDKTLYAGLVLVNTKVKVVYGFGYGTAHLGQASPVNDKILAMTGEYTTICQPTVFVFEPSIRNKPDIIAPLLDEYANKGCSVDCSPDWSHEHIKAALLRGNHTSTNAKHATQALREETQTKQANKYARVVKWKEIKHNIPKMLKVSPVAMIPHKSRAFRCILDLSFQLNLKGKKMPSVNSATAKLAPREGMVQLGQALKCLIVPMAANRSKGTPLQFAKLDIKDGFWRMAVGNEDRGIFAMYFHQKTTKLTSMKSKL